jgi:hypothetical protein
MQSIADWKIYNATRVTRLAEFSINELFTLSSFVIITEVAHILGVHFAKVEVIHALISDKNTGLDFDRLFSRTHLVTLADTSIYSPN